LSVEENHTQELLKGQLREKSLRDALQTSEEKMSDQWRVNDKLAALGDKYREALAEKERLQQVVDTQEKSLTKLQHVLHQFTREKERDVLAAQKELALKLARAEALQAEKDSEIGHLRRKLSEAQLGLEAAARLTQQLDKTSAALSAAKEEGKHFWFQFLQFSFKFCTNFVCFLLICAENPLRGGFLHGQISAGNSGSVSCRIFCAASTTFALVGRGANFLDPDCQLISGRGNAPTNAPFCYFFHLVSVLCFASIFSVDSFGSGCWHISRFSSSAFDSFFPVGGAFDSVASFISSFGGLLPFVTRH
jgi:hypothetical protein